MWSNSSAFKIESNYAITGIPGNYIIKNNKAQLNKSDIYNIAKFISSLVHILHSTCNCVVGIYWEWHTRDYFTISVIPFHISAMEELEIPYEPYQPYIKKYLTEFPRKKQYYEMEYSITKNLENSVLSQNNTLKYHSQKISGKDKYLGLEPIFEVWDLEEIPCPPIGKKYFACIGGNRNYQVFMGDVSMSRGEFMYSYEMCYEHFLRPIKISDTMQVKQDAKYAIPGFFIISPISEYHYISDMPWKEYADNIWKAYQIREKLITVSGIRNANIYYDEHYKKPSSVHFWVLPIYEKENQKLSMLDHSIWTYMDTFEYKNNKKKIIEVRNWLEGIIHELQ